MFTFTLLKSIFNYVVLIILYFYKKITINNVPLNIFKRFKSTYIFFNRKKFKISNQIYKSYQNQ